VPCETSHEQTAPCRYSVACQSGVFPSSSLWSTSAPIYSSQHVEVATHGRTARGGGQMRSVACEALWKLANKIPIDINECSAMFYSDWTPMTAATSNVQNRYFSSATPIASSIGIDPDATTPMHVGARAARKRIVQSDDEDLLEEEVIAVSASFQDADDDEMPPYAPVRASESMGSNGDMLVATASTSRTTRLGKRPVRSTPYQRVRTLLGQRARAPANRTRGRPATGDYVALSSVRR
jgi:hypothetical protein